MVQQLPVAFLGIEFEQVGITQTLEWTVEHSTQEKFAYLVTPNVDHIVQLHGPGKADAARAFRDADFVVCDSRILSLLARLSGLRVPVVPGSDLTPVLLRSLADETRIAVVGGDPELLAALVSHYPRYEWMAHFPPMGVRTDPLARQAIADFVCESRANIVLFGKRCLQPT